jgi:phospholipase/carboxylesterase
MLDSLEIPSTDGTNRARLLVLHGLGDSLHGWSWLPDELRLPWLSYRLVNAPDSYFGGFSWYDLQGDQGVGIRRSRQLLTELIDAELATGRPPERLGLLGFSQGCVMTFDAGWRHPARLGALVGISGYVFEEAALLAELGPHAREVPALFTHGTRDPIIPLAPVREQVRLLQSAGLDLTWQEFDKAHTIAGTVEIERIRDFLNRRLK